MKKVDGLLWIRKAHFAKKSLTEDSHLAGQSSLCNLLPCDRVDGQHNCFSRRRRRSFQKHVVVDVDRVLAPEKWRFRL